ncbi:MAG: queuine tRNA-ribosyltransferase [Nitrososphaerales archaeon]|nr:queuine tRNA-ribosyltransferase [Nitrososphaerales archaeon]
MDPKKRLSMTIDYLFGRGTSSVIPVDRLNFAFSKRTGRMKSVLLDGKLLATLRSDGGIALTIHGADLLTKHPGFFENCVVVGDEAREYVSMGRSAFVKHVVSCGDRIRPGSEVVVVDTNRRVIAVGKAILSARMMRSFKQGVAVKVREGIKNV